jgi:hypothetical protein
MAYRHPSGEASDLSSGEFLAPSLAPPYCAWNAALELAGEGDPSDPPEKGEQLFVDEFVREVLLRLGQDEPPEDVIDLATTQSQSQAASHARAASSAGAVAPRAAAAAAVPTPRPPRPPTESILVQMDAILRQRNMQQHYSVEIESVHRLSSCKYMRSSLCRISDSSLTCIIFVFVAYVV